MAMDTAVGEAQRLHRRLRQTVDQDRRGGEGAQLRHHRLDRLDVDAGGIAIVMLRIAQYDCMPSLEGADDDGVVVAVTCQFGIGGEGGGSPQIYAAANSFLAEEIGFHMHVAIAEQQDVDAALQAVCLGQCMGSFDRPVRV